MNAFSYQLLSSNLEVQQTCFMTRKNNYYQSEFDNNYYNFFCLFLK